MVKSLCSSDSREEIIEHIPKGSIAYYLPNPRGRKKVFFTKETLLLMYHLIRLKYFSREMILDQYFILTGKELYNDALYALIGNSRMPICQFSSNYNIGRTKFMYVPKVFASWVLSVIPQIPELAKLTEVTEYDGSHYSLITNRMNGGTYGIKKINLHDANTRSLALKIGRALIEKKVGVSPSELNITYFFPTNRELISVVPDAVIFVQGKRYYIEYDRNTEQHFKLLGKIIGYFEESYYKGDTIFFVFDNISEPKDNYLNARVMNFISNVHTVKFKNSGLTYYEQAQQNKVSLYALPYVNAISQIAEVILLELDHDSTKENIELVDRFKNEHLVPYDVLSADLVDEPDSPFDLTLTYIDDFFDKKEMPLLKLNYGDISNPDYFENLYKEYKDVYPQCGIIFSASISKQYYPIPHDDFFLAIYIR